ncbi:hypothetical protein BKH43_05485 [Helicobacter sp. 13S00401-1]|uniref:hypothetical protein n=1 Tax=Helicobacter sp. 13S00401-1 TaxID=1905758 RepID=UPI000BD72A92|nr:hypothetical protein [Helicobacter sp. 13S00401-1]PAF50221.1 hypothetical protein BKH43_05485 [Helicobacter sp. 13S00401-1]
MIDKTNALNSLASAKSKELLDNLKSKKLSENDKALRAQTDKFEALFIKNLLDISLKLDNPLYPKQPGNEIYESMFKDQLAGELSGHFGYSELLFNFLKAKEKLS